MSTADQPPLLVGLSRQPLLYGIIWSFGSIAILAIITRLYVRCRLTTAAGLDDAIIGICGVSRLSGLHPLCTSQHLHNAANNTRAYGLPKPPQLVIIPLNVLTTLAVHYGYGEHIQDVPLWSLSKALRLFDVELPGSYLLLILLKLSVWSLIEGIFDVPRSHRHAFYVALWLLFAIGVATLSILYVSVKPVSGLWSPELLSTQVLPRALVTNMLVAVSALSAVLDAVLAIYPATKIRNLHILAKERLKMSLLICFGAVAVAMAIAKCCTLYEFSEHADPLYTPVDSMIFMLMECYTLTFAACLPTFGPLFYRPRANPRFSGPTKELRSGSSTSTSHRMERKYRRRWDDSLLDSDVVEEYREISLEAFVEGSEMSPEPVHIQREVAVSGEQRRADEPTEGEGTEAKELELGLKGESAMSTGRTV